MDNDRALEVLKRYQGSEATVQFWTTDTPAETFTSLRDCVLFVADAATGEPLPDVHVHDPEGEITFSGPDLEALIASARGLRTAD